MLAYLVLLYDPTHAPFTLRRRTGKSALSTLLWELAEEFRSYSVRGGQVLSRRIAGFLNAIQIGEFFLPVKGKKDFTQVLRAHDPQLSSTCASDQRLLWKEGLLEG